MIPDLSKCGLDLNILNLDLANKAIEEAMKALASGAGGIADNIANLKSQLEADFNTALAQLDGLIPEFPDLPPNLQLEMAKLVGALNDPLALVAQIARIENLFGAAPGVDLNTLLGDLAALAKLDLCKDIPNLDAKAVTDADGNTVYQYVKKGEPPKAPVKDAVEPPPPPAPKKVETVTPKDTKRTITPVTQAESAAAGPKAPPAQKPLTTPAETTTVDWSDDFKKLVEEMDKGRKMHIVVGITDPWMRTPVVFNKHTHTLKKDGSKIGKEFWSPGPYWTSQLHMERYLSYKILQIYFSCKHYVKQEKKVPTFEYPDQKAEREARIAQLKVIGNLCIKIAKNGGEKAQGPEGTFSRKSASSGLAKDVKVTVSEEQAKRSQWPKPEGSWGQYPEFSILTS